MSKEMDALERIGIEGKEAKVYLALLYSGSSNVTKLSEDVNVDRVAIYDVLNRLIKRGIASYVLKDGIKYFNVVSPEELLKDLLDKEQEFKEVMPRLLALAKSGKEKTNVEVFKGKKGMLYVINMCLTDKKDYLFIGAAHEISKTFPIHITKFLKEAHDLRLKGRLICEEGFGNSDVDIIGKNETYRIISKEFTSTTTKIWGNKTVFFIFEEPYYTILIENKEIADRHRLYFDYLWKLAKDPSKVYKKRTLIKN